MSYEHLTVEEVAKVLKLSTHRVYEACRLGLIPHIRIGRQVRVPEDALKTWIIDGGKGLEGGWRNV